MNLESKETILNTDGQVYLLHNWLSREEADVYFKKLQQQVKWQQEVVHIFGKKIPCPRLTAWYGDKGVAYEYSGIRHVANGWCIALEELRDMLAQVGYIFNSVLCNYYRDGSDSMGWHADNEDELGENPIIASISLGEQRKFKFKHKYSNVTKTIELPHGSLLLMEGKTQQFWLHSLLKTKVHCCERINITFRNVRFNDISV